MWHIPALKHLKISFTQHLMDPKPGSRGISRPQIATGKNNILVLPGVHLSISLVLSKCQYFYIKIWTSGFSLIKQTQKKNTLADPSAMDQKSPLASADWSPVVAPHGSVHCMCFLWVTSAALITDRYIHHSFPLAAWFLWYSTKCSTLPEVMTSQRAWF